jgi:hypothetical protein
MTTTNEAGYPHSQLARGYPPMGGRLLGTLLTDRSKNPSVTFGLIAPSHHDSRPIVAIEGASTSHMMSIRAGRIQPAVATGFDHAAHIPTQQQCAPILLHRDHASQHYFAVRFHAAVFCKKTVAHDRAERPRAKHGVGPAAPNGGRARDLATFMALNQAGRPHADHGARGC